MIDTAVILGSLTVREFRDSRILAEWIVQRIDKDYDALLAHGPHAVDGTFLLPAWITMA